MENLEKIVVPLIDWYQLNHRVLPWRTEKTPYRVWVSEIMLQQTRVEAVKEYFNRFMREIPDVSSLANIDDDKLLKLWEGLGYYNRARNLKKAANKIVEQGVFPNTYEELVKLPGIGDYTAGAIASICYLERVSAIDGNVLRVISRIVGSYDNIADNKTKEKIRELLIPILPERVDLFNQALMELGALICVPNGEPNCEQCPVHDICFAYNKHETSNLPVKKKKELRKIEERTVLFISDRDTIVLQKRESRGLLAGMYEFPNYLNHLTEKEILEAIGELREHVIRIEFLGDTKHIFSHIEWHMHNYFIVLDMLPKNLEKLWVTLSDLDHIYAVPTAFSKGRLLYEDRKES